MKAKARQNLLKVKRDALNTEIALNEESIELTNNLIEEAKADGEDLEVDLIDTITQLDESKIDANQNLESFTESIRTLVQDGDNSRTDTERLTELRKTYTMLDKKLAETVAKFKDANQIRVEARSRVINMREELNTHLDENVVMPVDLAEVEDLCKMIEEKDKVLMLDLMRVKDQINAAEAWKADA